MSRERRRYDPEQAFIASQYQLTWQRFRKHRLAIAGGVVPSPCWRSTCSATACAPPPTPTSRAGAPRCGHERTARHRGGRAVDGNRIQLYSKRMRVVVADASSLILLAKCSLLFEYSRGVELQVPRQAFEEVASASLVRRYDDAALVAKLARDGSIRVVAGTTHRDLPRALGRGEAAAIRLWFEADADLVLSDDGRAIRTCRILAIPFTSSPRVVVDLYRTGAVPLAKARKALEVLAVTGRYGRDMIAAAMVALQEVRQDDQTNDDPSA